MTQPDRPYLEIQPPDGQPYTLCLKDLDHCTIGRDDDNDLCLPDPEKFISREHFRLEKINGYWWIIDDEHGASGRPSASGTFLYSTEKERDINVQENGRERLHNNDYFYVIARVVNDDDYQYWTFTFRDDEASTRELPGRIVPPQHPQNNGIYYSLSTRTLMKANGEILPLPKTPTVLVRFMAKKNQDRGGQPTPCRFQEMIEAVWGDGDKSWGKTNGDITRLVWQIRQKIETDPANPQYIENLMADGYIFKIPLRPWDKKQAYRYNNGNILMWGKLNQRVKFP